VCLLKCLDTHSAPLFDYDVGIHTRISNTGSILLDGTAYTTRKLQADAEGLASTVTLTDTHETAAEPVNYKDQSTRRNLMFENPEEGDNEDDVWNEQSNLDVNSNLRSMSSSKSRNGVCAGAGERDMPFHTHGVVDPKTSTWKDREELIECLSDVRTCTLGAARYAQSLKGVQAMSMQKALSFAGLAKQDKCAVVGNAGHMLEKTYGPYVDKHSLVVRFNMLRTTKYSSHVGQKTSLRWLNHARSFAVCKHGMKKIPEFNDLKKHGAAANLKAVVLWHPDGREEAQACLTRLFNGAPKVEVISEELKQDMRATMKALRSDLVELGFGEGMKDEMPDELTSGAQATLILVRMCKEVSIYGLSTYNPVSLNSTKYQYGGRDNLRASGHKYHDWIVESGAWKLLNAAGVINICTMDNGTEYVLEQDADDGAMEHGERGDEKSSTYTTSAHTTSLQKKRRGDGTSPSKVNAEDVNEPSFEGKRARMRRRRAERAEANNRKASKKNKLVAKDENAPKTKRKYQ